LTNKRLGINTNFNREVTDATLDLVGDDNQQTQRNLQKMKWDRKKKKFVSMQSTLDKAKRIKTESGSYIKASYKSDLYSKWLKKSKTGDRDNQGDENNGDDDGDNKQQSFKNKKYFGSSLSGEFNYMFICTALNGHILIRV
jgi:ATP-dependent RNA helicase DDX54/DBP10